MKPRRANRFSTIKKKICKMFAVHEKSVDEARKVKHGKEEEEEERKLRLRVFLLKAIKVLKRFFNCRFNALVENPTDLIR